MYLVGTVNENTGRLPRMQKQQRMSDVNICLCKYLTVLWFWLNLPWRERRRKSCSCSSSSGSGGGVAVVISVLLNVVVAAVMMMVLEIIWCYTFMLRNASPPEAHLSAWQQSQVSEGQISGRWLGSSGSPRPAQPPIFKSCAWFDGQLGDAHRTDATWPETSPHFR